MPPPGRPRGDKPFEKKPHDRLRTEDSESNGSAYTTLRVAKFGPPVVQCNDRRKQHPSYQQANGFTPNSIKRQMAGPSHSPFRPPLRFNEPSNPYPRHPPFFSSSFDVPSGSRLPFQAPTGPKAFRQISGSRPRDVRLQKPTGGSERHASTPRSDRGEQTPSRGIPLAHAENAKKNKKKRKIGHAGMGDDEEEIFNSAYFPTLSQPVQRAMHASPARPQTPPLPPPDLSGPPPRLVFKPNKPQITKGPTPSASSSREATAGPSMPENSSLQSRQQTSALIDEKHDHHSPRRLSTHTRLEDEVDRKPSLAELEAPPSKAPAEEEPRDSGVWAFRKDETPAACWSKIGSEKSTARQAFKNAKKAELRKMGKAVSQTMWRDDGFALVWARIVPPPPKGSQPQTRLQTPQIESTPQPGPSRARPASPPRQRPKDKPTPTRRAEPGPDKSAAKVKEAPVPAAPVRRQSTPPVLIEDPRTLTNPPIQPTASSSRVSTHIPDAEPASVTQPRTTPQPDIRTEPNSEKLQKLEADIQSDLAAIDRWTTMQKDFPRQSETLGRQIDRVQASIFAKFTLVEEEKARLAAQAA